MIACVVEVRVCGFDTDLGTIVCEPPRWFTTGIAEVGRVERPFHLSRTLQAQVVDGNVEARVELHDLSACNDGQ